jgi:hypothetical protein
MEAVNITLRKSLKEDITASISLDGALKYVTRPSRLRWDETIDVQIDHGNEIEIQVNERDGMILGLIWFKLADLVSDLDEKFGKARQLNMDMPDTVLDLQPSGQISMKINFISASKEVAAKGPIFRRDAVQKVYPRNGHRYIARQFYQVMQCTICTEFLGRTGYQCVCKNLFTQHAITQFTKDVIIGQ